MKRIIKWLPIFLIIGLFQACEEKNELEAKKEELSKLRSDASELKTKINQLENEIVALDPDFGKNANNIILVTTTNIKPSSFEHKIEVRGTVESRKNVMVSAEVAGRIEQIRVKEGESVKKGQVLLTLDAEIIRNNLAELKTSLELAKIVYERQSNLWEKRIGTEIQYLEAKNAKESLERRLATTQSQLDQATVRAPFSGSVDEVPVKVGEMASPGFPLVRIVNPDDMYIQADISETYIGKFKKGEEVQVHFPSQNRNLVSKISSVSQVINRDNRTFAVELELPIVDFIIKPNQVSVLKMRDYLNESAFTVPTKLIQRDGQGTFIYGTENSGEAITAKKIHVETGMSYDSRTEIVAGIKNQDQIIDRGFRDVTEGVEVKIASDQTAGN